MALLRRAAAPATLLTKLLLNPRGVCRSTCLLCRSFNTTDASQNDNTRFVDVDRLSDASLSRRSDSNSPAPFSDVVDPLSPTRSLSQVLNWVDQLMEDPLSVMAPRIKGRGPRRAWDAKEDENALNLRMDMPGLSKDVKVMVEQNTLIVKGQASSEEEAAESGGGRRYVSRLDLPPNVYKLDSIKAEMKNGVLRLVTPKVKDEERKDVYQVQAD